MDYQENNEQWREASSELYSLIWQSVRDAGEEILEYNRDAIDVSDVADAITEQADGLIPVYYGEQVREWYALGLPDADYENGQAGIFAGIQSALFEWYHGELSRVVAELLEEKAGN
jgi:hypothetical protein